MALTFCMSALKKMHRLTIVFVIVATSIAQAASNNFLVQPHSTPIQLAQSTTPPLLTLDTTLDKQSSADTATQPVHLVPSLQPEKRISTQHSTSIITNADTHHTNKTHTDSLARIHNFPLYLNSTATHASAMQGKSYIQALPHRNKTSSYQLQLGHALSQANRLHPIQQQQHAAPGINYQLMLSGASLPSIHNNVSRATPNSSTMTTPANVVKTTTNRVIPSPNNTYIAPFPQHHHVLNNTLIQELPKAIASLPTHNQDLQKMMLLFAANDRSYAQEATAYIPPIAKASDIPHALSQHALQADHTFIQPMADLRLISTATTHTALAGTKYSPSNVSKTTTAITTHAAIPPIATSSNTPLTSIQPIGVAVETTTSSFIASAPLRHQSALTQPSTQQAHAISPVLNTSNSPNSSAKATPSTMKQAATSTPLPTDIADERQSDSDIALERSQQTPAKQPTKHYLYTLTQVLDRTVRTNPEILAERANWLRSEHLIHEARGGLYPSIDLQFNYSTETSRNPTLREQAIDTINLNRRSTNVVVSQLLFDGGNVYNRFKNAEGNAQATRFRLVSIKQTVVLGAIEAYVNVLRYTELKRLALLNIETHEQAFAKVNQRFKAGAGRSSDVELASARLALAKATLQSVIDNYNRAHFSFIRLTGIEPEKLQPIDVPSKLLPAEVTQAEHLGLTKNPSVKEADAQVVAALANVKVANANFFPRVNFNVSSRHDLNLNGIRGSNDSEQVGVQMSYNIFKGGSDVATKRAAIEEYRSTQQNAENVKRTTLQNIRSSWSSYQLLKKRLPLLKIHLGAMINTAESYREQFKLGQRTLLDELNANTEIFNAQNNVTDAKFQLVINAYVLLFETGQLYSS